MRIALLGLAATLGACVMPIAPKYALRVGIDGRVSHRSHAAEPRWFLGLRLNLVSR